MALKSERSQLLSENSFVITGKIADGNENVVFYPSTITEANIIEDVLLALGIDYEIRETVEFKKNQPLDD